MSKVLRKIARAKIDRYAAAVIHRLRRIRSESFQPDEYPARNVWDLWKLEMQEEPSVIHEMLHDLVESVVETVVAGLPWDEVAFLTTALGASDDHSEAIADADLVTRELSNELATRAADEPHRREIQAMLDGASLDRFERDTEAH